MYSRSATTSPYDGSSWRRVEYTCNESSATRTRFSGLTGGKYPESPAHQLLPLGFGEVRDSHSKGQLLERSGSGMVDDSTESVSEMMDGSKGYGDRKGKQ
jgi:hypothetical protein